MDSRGLLPKSEVHSIMMLVLIMPSRIISVSLMPNSSLVAVSKSFTASAKELSHAPDVKHLSSYIRLVCVDGRFTTIQSHMNS